MSGEDFLIMVCIQLIKVDVGKRSLHFVSVSHRGCACVCVYVCVPLSVCDRIPD